MGVDPNNPVVRLCVAGIAAEMAGRRDEAAKMYQDAWDARTNDFDACIAAHYVARLQPTPQAALHWNSEALRLAEAAKEAAKEATMKEFLPSLYLNLGKSHEDLGNFAEAMKFYRSAENEIDVLPGGDYSETVKRGVRRGLERVASAGGGSAAAQYP